MVKNCTKGNVDPSSATSLFPNDLNHSKINVASDRSTDHE